MTKTCCCCGFTAPEAELTCPACGEASWLLQIEPELPDAQTSDAPLDETQDAAPKRRRK